jgi:hypothetical protein
MSKMGWLLVSAWLLSGVSTAGDLTEWAGGDCKALAKGDPSYCRTDNCKAIVKKDASYCR